MPTQSDKKYSQRDKNFIFYNNYKATQIMILRGFSFVSESVRIAEKR